MANKMLQIDGQWWWQPDRAYQAFWILPQPLMKYLALNKTIQFLNKHSEISSAKTGWREKWVDSLGNLNFIGPAGREYFATNWLMPPNQVHDSLQSVPELTISCACRVGHAERITIATIKFGKLQMDNTMLAKKDSRSRNGTSVRAHSENCFL